MHNLSTKLSNTFSPPHCRKLLVIKHGLALEITNKYVRQPGVRAKGIQSPTEARMPAKSLAAAFSPIVCTKSVDHCVYALVDLRLVMADAAFVSMVSRWTTMPA